MVAEVLLLPRSLSSTSFLPVCLLRSWLGSWGDYTLLYTLLSSSLMPAAASTGFLARVLPFTSAYSV